MIFLLFQFHPPPMKKKSISGELEEKIDAKEIETSDLDDLSVILEDMDIDIMEEESTKELSRKMDEKLRENENKQEEMETAYKTRPIEEENKKRKTKGIKEEKPKTLRKKQTQKQKDI